MPETDRQLGNIGTHEGGPSSPFVTGADEMSAGGIQLALNALVQIGQRIEQQSAKLDAAMQRLQRFTPVDYGVGASATCVSGSTPLILNLGSPDMGTYWEVEQVAVGGSDGNVTVGGMSVLYVTSNTLLAGNQFIGGGMSNVADIAKTLPNVGFYGRRDIVVMSQEYLVAVVYGGTPGVIYNATGSVSVYNVAAAQGRDVTVN